MPEESNLSTLSAVQRWAEKRMLVHVPVEVTEVDHDGNLITERTYIEDVSDFGCRFSTRGSPHQGDIVAVRILGPTGKPPLDEQPQFYEIMWTAPKKQGTTAGARLVQGEKLADLKFPPLNGGHNQGSK